MYSTFVQPADFDKFRAELVVCWTAQWPYLRFSPKGHCKWHGNVTATIPSPYPDNNHFAFRTLPSYGIGLIK